MSAVDTEFFRSDDAADRFFLSNADNFFDFINIIGILFFEMSNDFILHGGKKFFAFFLLDLFAGAFAVNRIVFFFRHGFYRFFDFGGKGRFYEFQFF